jgi:hypothetical protein
VVVISAAVEGLIDEAVVKRLITEAGATVGPVYGKQGKKVLRAGINGYNKAARHRPWIVLWIWIRKLTVLLIFAAPGFLKNHRNCASALLSAK